MVQIHITKKEKRLIKDKRSVLMDIENRVVAARGYRLGGGMAWELGISRCKLL